MVNQAGIIILKASQFDWCLDLNKAPSAWDSYEIPLLAASSLMGLLPWSPHTEGRKNGHLWHW